VKIDSIAGIYGSVDYACTNQLLIRVWSGFRMGKDGKNELLIRHTPKHCAHAKMVKCNIYIFMVMVSIRNNTVIKNTFECWQQNLPFINGEGCKK